MSKPAGGQSGRVRTGVHPDERALMRDKGTSATDKLVTTIRLGKLQKEFTSIGALLDTRHMFDLEDPDKYRPKKAKRSETTKRENILGTDNALVADTAVAKFEETQLQQQLAEVEKSFSTEKLIWKAKSQAPEYFLKREFERQDLVNFCASMKSEQRKGFKTQCKQRLYEICTKIRSTCNKKLNKMSDVFHPDANSQRAHCLYIMRVYKAITAGNLEDPIMENLMVITSIV